MRAASEAPVRAALAVLFLLAACTRAPAYVEEVVVANPTAYDVNVEVRPAEAAGAWLPIGRARHGHDTPFGQVVDQGATWIVRFGYAGVEGGEITLRREDLERSKWRITVPETVGSRLQDAGVVPPPG
jgi:hypothetical protein